MLVTYSDFKDDWDKKNLPEGAKIFVSLPMRDREEKQILRRMNDIFEGICRQLKKDDLALVPW